MPASLNIHSTSAGERGMTYFFRKDDFVPPPEASKFRDARTASIFAQLPDSLHTRLKTVNSIPGKGKPPLALQISQRPEGGEKSPSGDDPGTGPDRVVWKRQSVHEHSGRNRSLSISPSTESEPSADAQSDSGTSIGGDERDSPVFHSWLSPAPVHAEPSLTSVDFARRLHADSFSDPAASFAGTAMDVVNACTAKEKQRTRGALCLGGLHLLEQSEQRVREAVYAHAKVGQDIARKIYERGSEAGQIGFSDLAINLALLREQGGDARTCDRLEKRLCKLLLKDRLGERSSFAVWFHNSNFGEVKALREELREALKALPGEGDSYEHVVKSIVLPAVRAQVEQQLGKLLPESAEVLQNSHPLLTAAARQAVGSMCDSLRHQGRGSSESGDHAMANIWRLAHHTAELMREVTGSGMSDQVSTPAQPAKGGSVEAMTEPPAMQERNLPSTSRQARNDQPFLQEIPPFRQRPAHESDHARGTKAHVDSEEGRKMDRGSARDSTNSQVINQNFRFEYGLPDGDAIRQINATREVLEKDFQPLRSPALVAAVQRVGERRQETEVNEQTLERPRSRDTVQVHQRGEFADSGRHAGSMEGVIPSSSRSGDLYSTRYLKRGERETPDEPQNAVRTVQVDTPHHFGKAAEFSAMRARIIDPVVQHSSLEIDQVESHERATLEIARQADLFQSRLLPEWMLENSQSTYQQQYGDLVQERGLHTAGPGRWLKSSSGWQRELEERIESVDTQVRSPYQRLLPKTGGAEIHSGHWIKSGSQWHQEAEKKPVILSMPNVGLDLMSRIPTRPISEVRRFSEAEPYPPVPPAWRSAKPLRIFSIPTIVTSEPDTVFPTR